MTLFTITRGKIKMILGPLALSLPPSVFHRAAMLLFFVTAACFADSAAMGLETSAPITAEDYCAFLNANAASDPLHFYDEKMATDLGGACVLRLGTVGSYRCQAEGGGLRAKGAEKNEAAPMSFLSYNDAVAFCQWKSQRDVSSCSLSPLCDVIDPELKSNQLFFKIVDGNCQQSGTLHAASGVGAASTIAESGPDELLIDAVFLLAGFPLGARYVENESLAENARRSETLEPSSSGDLANHTTANYKSPMLTLEHFHDIAQQHPEADILLHEDADGNQTLHAASKNQQSSRPRSAALEGISVAEDLNSKAHQKAHAVFSSLVKEKIEKLGTTLEQWNAITHLSPALQEGEQSPLSAAHIFQVMQSIPSPWHEAAVDHDSIFKTVYEKLSRPNEAGMKKVFGESLVLFNEPEMGKKIEATKQEHQEKQTALEESLRLFFEKNPWLPKITAKNFLIDREASKEALLKGIADYYTNAPATKKTLEQEVAALTNHAQACKILAAKKDAQEETSRLFSKFKLNSMNVYKRSFTSDQKLKPGFAFTLRKYQSIAEKLALFGENYEVTRCNLEALPVNERPTVEPGNSWLNIMQQMVEHLISKERPTVEVEKSWLNALLRVVQYFLSKNQEVVPPTEQNVEEAKKFDRIILYTQGKVRENALEIEARGEQTTAARLGDQRAAALWEKIADDHHEANMAYLQAADCEKYNNRVGAEIFGRTAEIYSKSASAHDQQAEALKKNDHEAAALWGKIINAYLCIYLGSSRAALLSIVPASQNNSVMAEAYSKSTSAYDQQVEALKQQLEALKKDPEAVELWSTIADAHLSAAYDYRLAADSQHQNNSMVAKAYSKSASAHDQRAEALKQKDTMTAAIWSQIATAHEDAAECYKRATNPEGHNDSAAVEAEHQAGNAHEQRAEALRRRIEKLHASRMASEKL